MTFVASNPGWTLRKLRRLRMRSPAAASKTNASAICDTTSILRDASRRRDPVAPRPPSRSTLRSTSERTSGKRPKAVPATTAQPRQNATLGHLELPGFHANEKQVGDVGGGDEEHDGHRSEQNPDRLRHKVADDVV